MSFWPFPKKLLDELSLGLAVGPGIELGSGAGQLHARLGSVGISLLATDLSGASDLCLDATTLPLRNETFGLVVAGNLLRHLGVSQRADLFREVTRVLRPGGRLCLLEDDVRGRTPAETNYRTTLEFLARVDPSRGPALDLRSALEARPEELAQVVWEGILENEERPVDVHAPLDWLEARGGIPDAELKRHRAEVLEHGMEYGRFQACVLERARGERG